MTQGRLGIRHLQHINMALLTKWVRRMMQPSGDLATVVRRDGYGSSLDREMWRTPKRGDSAFMPSMRPCFPQVQKFFQPQLGTGRPSGSGLITGRGTADWIGFSLVSTLYSRIGGFWCSGLGMMLGFCLCPRYCPTNGWLS